MNREAYKIALIGGGHSHVAVLADWARHGRPADRVLLLTPHPFLRYSGMVPGWISGEYPCDAGLVDLATLAKAAGADLVLDRCVAIDPETRTALTLENGVIGFDLASIDVGGVGRAADMLGRDDRLIDVRPIERFVARIDGRLDDAKRVAVIGGGAGGVELAFGLRNRVSGNRDGPSRRPKVTLIAGERGLLPDLSGAVRRKVAAQLDHQGIDLVTVDAWLERCVLMAGEVEVPADLIVAAVGSGAPDWPGAGGLAVDNAGFIAVDRFQRSISHPHIFAAGDCAQRMDRRVDHAGVHAVHTGPVLAENVRAAIKGQAPTHSYRPRPASLYLISTGQGEAIASYGPFAVQGRMVARLKAWIDKRWIATYAAIGKGVP